MDDRPPIRPRSLTNSDAERARTQLHQGERRAWEDDSEVASGWFEAGRRAFLRWRYPVESSHSPEQAIIDSVWNQLVHAINDLSDQERSNLDTDAIGGVVPVHSTASGHVVSIRRFADGSSQLLVSHQFIAITLVLSTLASFQLSRPALRLAISRFGAPTIAGAPPEQYAALARSAIVRDLLIQLNFHGIIASYRPRLTASSALLFRSALTFAMAHEAAHLLIGDRDSPEAQPSRHIRADGTIAESQWGRELAQDRLALRLSRHVASTQAVVDHASRLSPEAAGDQVLSSALVSLTTLHILECGHLVGKADSHSGAIDRLGSLMIEFNPLTSPIVVGRIKRLLPVVDTCLFLEPLPIEAWDLLASLIRARILRTNERRRTAVRMIESAKASDVVLTARAEYAHIYDYLTSVQDIEEANGKCLNLLRTHGREALPKVLDLLGIPRDDILASSTQLTRRNVAQIISHSSRIRIPSGIDRQTYVDIWASVVSAALNEVPDRNRLLYHLLDLGEDGAEETDLGGPGGQRPDT